MPFRQIRTALSHRLTRRREHRRLSAELAAFQTPAERLELDEMIKRYPAEETREIRRILARQELDRQRAAAFVAGHPHNRVA